MNTNHTINTELVRKIAADKGFFYIEAKKCFGEDYIGPEYIVATNDKEFLLKHPEYAEMIIMSVDKFILMAEPINTYNNNERKAKRRQITKHNEEGYYEDDCITDAQGNPITLKIKDFPLSPVEDEAEKGMIRETLYEALESIKEKQKQRIISYYIYGETQQEIADKEGVNRFAVEKSIILGIEKIKKFFEKRVSK